MVNIKKILWILALGCTITLLSFVSNRSLSVSEVFERITKLERFETMPVSDDVFCFPENLGKGTMAIHPNASPRAEIVGLLNRMSKESLVFDETDADGRFDRFFFENDNTLLYVHVSTSTGDTVVIIFRDCNKDKVESFIEELKAHQRLRKEE